MWRGTHIFDDYAHHPNEIIPTIKVARKRTQRRLIVVFQPHRYTRTRALWHEFINTFAHAPVDELIITDIYPASEDPIPGITSGRLTQEIQTANPLLPISYLPLEKNFLSIKHALQNIVQPDDLLLLLGAGNINRFPETLE